MGRYGGRLLGMRLAHQQMSSLTNTAEGLLLRRYRVTDEDGALALASGLTYDPHQTGSTQR